MCNLNFMLCWFECEHVFLNNLEPRLWVGPQQPCYKEVKCILVKVEDNVTTMIMK